MTKMRNLPILLALCLLPAPALAGSVVASLGDVSVTTEDFDAELLRMPPELRTDFRTDPKRVAKVVENILVTRALATGAKANGIDRDAEAMREIQISAEKILARRERERIEASIQVPDLGKRAEELYKTNRDRYAVQPTYRTQHILVSLRCRSKDEGLARVTQARKEIVAGLGFEEAVARYSDDPSAAKNKGDIGPMTIDKVAAEYGEVMQKLKPGEISQPVQTQFGWHIIKLIDSTPRVPYRFEEVRESIIAELRNEYIRARTDEIIGKIRSDPAIKINTEAMDSLVVSIQPGAPAKPASPR
jgi:parvulin-like peptidyl-prolyl isomerase